MKQILKKVNAIRCAVFALTLLCGGAVVQCSALAQGRHSDKEDKEDKEDRDERRDRNEKGRPSEGGDRGRHDKGGYSNERRGHFEDRHRTYAREYYSEQYRGGHCPPGLARKNNGCLPPGQARRWNVGYALPRDVVYYNVPPALVVQFGQAPQGYRYVRVASDILLIALGTGMVIDAIQNLGGL